MIVAIRRCPRGRRGRVVVFRNYPRGLPSNEFNKKHIQTMGVVGESLLGRIWTEGRAIKWGRVNPQAEATNSAPPHPTSTGSNQKSGGWRPWGSKTQHESTPTGLEHGI